MDSFHPIISIVTRVFCKRVACRQNWKKRLFASSISFAFYTVDYDIFCKIADDVVYWKSDGWRWLRFGGYGKEKCSVFLSFFVVRISHVNEVFGNGSNFNIYFLNSWFFDIL